MRKYKNIGRGFGVIISGITYDFQNGQVVEVPDNFKSHIVDSMKQLHDVSPPGTPAPKPIVTDGTKWTEETLKGKSLKELKGIGKGFSVTDRSKKRLMAEILKAQEEKK